MSAIKTEDVSLQTELLSPGEEAAIREAFRISLGGVSQFLAAQGDSFLERVTPQRWLLEWGLPLWLGESFGLTTNAAHTLALCNILGLAYIRIQDDLADGDLSAALRPGLVALSSIAFQQAMAHYARFFASDERFWTALELRLGQWAQGLTFRADLAPNYTAQPDHQSLYRLSHAGAPVHIGLVAACLLSHRGDILPRLGAALDDWLLASVLLDHARDWTADLEAGRYNYFIAHSTAIEQAPAQRQSIDQAMLQMILLGDGGESYFDFVRKLLKSAHNAAQPAGCARLNAYLEWFAEQTAADLREYRQQAAEPLRAASRLLFGEA